MGFLGLCYKNAAATLNNELVTDDDDVSTDTGETNYDMLSDEEEWNVVSNDQQFLQEQFEEEAYTYPQAWGDDQEMDMPVALPGCVTQRVFVKRLSPVAVMPTRGTEGAAGLDLSSVADITIPAGGKESVPTGLCIVPPKGLCGRIAPRSGLAYKKMIGAGVIDSDFTGELQVIIFNHGTQDFKVSVGDRIAQLILTHYSDASCEEVKELPTTVRGENGFGSTGVRLSVPRDTVSASAAPIISSPGNPGAEFPAKPICVASHITENRQSAALESLNSKLANSLLRMHDDDYSMKLR